MSTPKHKNIDPCPHPQCGFLRERSSTSCPKCDGQLHAISSNWDDYNQDTGQGCIYFLTICPSCGYIHDDGPSTCRNLEDLRKIDNVLKELWINRTKTLPNRLMDGTFLNDSTTTMVALLGKACGDAFGAPFEYNPRFLELSRKSLSEKRYLTWEDCGNKPRWSRIPGLYTDDTQQALMLLHAAYCKYGHDRAELLYHTDKIKAEFMRIGKELHEYDAERGTGKNYRKAIETGTPQDTAGLGAAMRIGPLATRPNEGAGVCRVMRFCDQICRATTTNAHGRAGGIWMGTAAWQLATGHCSDIDVNEIVNHGKVEKDYYNISLNEASKLEIALGHMAKVFKCINNVNDEDDVLLSVERATQLGRPNHVLQGPADGYALTAVPLVIAAVKASTSFEDAMARVSAYGRDADTTCAMAGCLAALKHGWSSIPKWMIDGLVGRDNIAQWENWVPLRDEAPLSKKDKDLQESRMRGKK